MGVKISLPTAALAACLEEVGIVFLFAPAMHSAMKYVQPARRELRLRTIFNLLGPLTNPAHASAQVVGVYSLDLVEKVAEALSMLGVHRALVVHGLDGLDEITITGPTRIAEVREGNVRTYEVTPEEFGIKRARLEDISGGDAQANAAIIREILAGKKSPRRDVVLLNAAAALVAAGRAEHLADALPLAAQSIDSGAAAAKLDALVQFTLTPDPARLSPGSVSTSDVRLPCFPLQSFNLLQVARAVGCHSFDQLGHREVLLDFRMIGRFREVCWFKTLQ